MSTSTFLTRAELALLRRLPFKVQSAYILALGQVIQLPQHVSSTFGEIFIDKLYQPMVPLPPDPTIVDLGTNTGMFCMYINQLVTGANLYCFEANPHLFPYLEKNLKNLPFRSNTVHAFNVAVSNQEGFLDFTYDFTNVANVASTAFIDISGFDDRTNFRTELVPCARLDKYVIGRIDFLKCDIEGAEYGILEDGLLTTERVGQAVIEFHELDKKTAAFRHIIEKAFGNGFLLYQPNSSKSEKPDDIFAYVENKKSATVRFCAPGATSRG